MYDRFSPRPVFILVGGALVASLGLLGCDGDPPAASGDSGRADGSTTPMDSGGAGADSGPTTGMDSGPAADAGPSADGDLPCDVREIMNTRCVTCHASPARFGAPMSLVTHAHFHVPAVTVPAEQVYQRVSARIHDDVSPMPQGAPRLTTAELAVMDAWVSAGAPARAAGVTCDGMPPPPPPPPPLSCTPSHEFLAHAAGSATAPYDLAVGGGRNQYICFTWRSPFATTTQATAWSPIVDDDRALHHWILYRTATSQPDGGVGPCDMPSDATFLMGWAPGGGNFVMPDDVGLELAVAAGESLILQVHYNNSAALTDVSDRSGVAICTTDTPRAQEAGILTLGTTAIDLPPRSRDVTVTGTCPATLTRFLGDDLHVLASGPHMHELGTRFVTEITSGGATTVLDRVDPWDFNSQVFYRHDPDAMMIRRGDTVTTRCTYDNPGSSSVSFGERTEDEMCFNFAMVYPMSAFPAGVPRVCTVR